jgi:integrase
MSLYKGADGIYEADIRMKDVGRIHLSMRTTRSTVAEPRYAALKRLFREAKGPKGVERRALIAQLRTGVVQIEQLESMVVAGEALVPAASNPTISATWPTVDAAIDDYSAWMKGNPNRRRSTWETALSALRRFADFEVDGLRLGERTLDHVKGAHFEAYQRELIETSTSVNTVGNYVIRIGALWAWVQRRENRAAVEGRRAAEIIHSPIDPEVVTRERASRDRWLTPKEGSKLLLAAPERLRFPIAASLFGGFRIGEILTLRTFADVDLELGTITIQAKQTGVEVNGRPIVWKPKTKRSERVVPISSDLRPFLEDHIGRFASDDWLMPGIENPGVPFEYATFNKHFTVVVVDAGLIAGRKDPRGVVFHTLRHTFASWMIMSGKVDLYTLSKLLGDTLQVVEDTYAHLAPDFKKRAIEALKGTIKVTAIVRAEPAKAAEDVENITTESATEEAISA